MVLFARDRFARDSRSTAELVQVLLKSSHSEAGRAALSAIQCRGGKEEFSQAKHLARSGIERERIAGIEILGELGWGDRTFLDESVEILLELLEDSSEAVVAAAAIALGHRSSEKAIEPLLARVGCDNPEIRFGVAFGLGGHDNIAAVRGLILLSADPDDEVRDWATFGLARQTELDSPEIREALLARTGTDEDGEIRGEALLGLALRGDRRSILLVARELGGEFHGDWSVEAAEILAEPEFFPLLVEQQRRLEPEDRKRFEKSFARALQACRSKKSATKD